MLSNYKAAKRGCDYFITLDEKTILKKARKFSAQLNNICPNLELGDPQDLLVKLTKF